MLARVVGKHCESGDIVVRDAFLPADLVPGDLVAVAATGAYCRSMASNYNHVPRPAGGGGRGRRGRVIVRRETEDDLLAWMSAERLEVRRAWTTRTVWRTGRRDGRPAVVAGVDRRSACGR